MFHGDGAFTFCFVVAEGCVVKPKLKSLASIDLSSLLLTAKLSSGEDVRDERDEDGQRECGQDGAPNEAEVVAVFPAFLRVNFVVVLDVRAEPTERTSPRRLLFLLASAGGVA